MIESKIYAYINYFIDINHKSKVHQHVVLLY